MLFGYFLGARRRGEMVQKYTEDWGHSQVSVSIQDKYKSARFVAVISLIASSRSLKLNLFRLNAALVSAAFSSFPVSDSYIEGRRT